MTINAAYLRKHIKQIAITHKPYTKQDSAWRLLSHMEELKIWPEQDNAARLTDWEMGSPFTVDEIEDIILAAQGWLKMETLEIDQYYSNCHSDLPYVDATLCIPIDNPAEAWVEESTHWAGTVKTPWPVTVLSYDNRGEPYREFAIASTDKGDFPLGLASAAKILNAIDSVGANDSLKKALVRHGLN